MLNSVFATLLVLGASIGCVTADINLHMPRGSNNRLDGTGANVQNNKRLFDSQTNDKSGYCVDTSQPSMYYYVGSRMTVEWTHQHSCAHPKSHCELVMQYMCDEELRDGITTDTIPDDANDYNEQVGGAVYRYGMHENYQYYQDCKARPRNGGLFAADQNVNPSTSISTRQDNNSPQYGFECPEERDYYPYWHPTPWKDIAVMTNDIERCEYYKTESQNVKPKNFCSINTHNNEADCVDGGGTWETQEAWGIDAPDCLFTPFTRDNHLGNAVGGYMPAYNWTIPDDANEHCAFRIRYNISTGDYEGWGPDMATGADNDEFSPIFQDPNELVQGHTLTLALNTDQYGRTFEDRSHEFAIRERPAGIPASARIYNVNVRGKRGNIVQVYPAVEYDFVPNNLKLRANDYVHFQWTGCDTNPNGNEGEGTPGTDRSNVVQIAGLNDNYPMDFSTIENPLFPESEQAFHMAHLMDETSRAACISLEQLIQETGSQNNADRDERNCAKLNSVGAYFDGGLQKMKQQGTFHYMSTRNNNFSNRSQKGTIFVEDVLGAWGKVVLSVTLAAFAVAAVLGFGMIYGRLNPDSSIASTFPQYQPVDH